MSQGSTIEANLKLFINILIIGGILGSPIWISGAILLIPRRWVIVDVLLCGLQATIALFLWWFFWGGGIGGEARLSQTWQWAGLFAVGPFVVCVVKYWTLPGQKPTGFSAR